MEPKALPQSCALDALIASLLLPILPFLGTLSLVASARWWWAGVLKLLGRIGSLFLRLLALRIACARAVVLRGEARLGEAGRSHDCVELCSCEQVGCWAGEAEGRHLRLSVGVSGSRVGDLS